MAAPEIALLLELVLDLKKDISALSQETAKNTVTLEEHMRRTEAAELTLAATQKRLEKLEKREWMISGFLKISGGLLTTAASIIAILEIIRRLH